MPRKAKKASKATKDQAKRLGIRLTLKRGDKRVAKSEAMLKRQIANKLKRKSKRPAKKVVRRKRCPKGKRRNAKTGRCVVYAVAAPKPRRRRAVACPSLKSKDACMGRSGCYWSIGANQCYKRVPKSKLAIPVAPPPPPARSLLGKLQQGKRKLKPVSKKQGGSHCVVYQTKRGCQNDKNCLWNDLSNECYDSSKNGSVAMLGGRYYPYY